MLVGDSCRGREYCFCRNVRFVAVPLVAAGVGTGPVVGKTGNWIYYQRNIVAAMGIVVVAALAVAADIVVAKELVAE